MSFEAGFALTITLCFMTMMLGMTFDMYNKERTKQLALRVCLEKGICKEYKE